MSSNRGTNEQNEHSHWRDKIKTYPNQPQRPLQNAAPIYLHSRKVNQSSRLSVSYPTEENKTSPISANYSYSGRHDPPSDIQVMDHHDYSSVTDSCVTGSKSLAISDPGTPDSASNCGIKTSVNRYASDNIYHQSEFMDTNVTGVKPSFSHHHCFHTSRKYTGYRNNGEKTNSAVPKRNKLAPVFSDEDDRSDNFYDGDKSSCSSDIQNPVIPSRGRPEYKLQGNDPIWARNQSNTTNSISPKPYICTPSQSSHTSSENIVSSNKISRNHSSVEKQNSFSPVKTLSPMPITPYSLSIARKMEDENHFISESSEDEEGLNQNNSSNFILPRNKMEGELENKMFSDKHTYSDEETPFDEAQRKHVSISGKTKNDSQSESKLFRNENAPTRHFVPHSDVDELSITSSTSEEKPFDVYNADGQKVSISSSKPALENKISKEMGKRNLEYLDTSCKYSHMLEQDETDEKIPFSAYTSKISNPRDPVHIIVADQEHVEQQHSSRRNNIQLMKRKEVNLRSSSSFDVEKPFMPNLSLRPNSDVEFSPEALNYKTFPSLKNRNYSRSNHATSSITYQSLATLSKEKESAHTQTQQNHFVEKRSVHPDVIPPSHNSQTFATESKQQNVLWKELENSLQSNSPNSPRNDWNTSEKDWHQARKIIVNERNKYYQPAGLEEHEEQQWIRKQSQTMQRQQFENDDFDLGADLPRLTKQRHLMNKIKRYTDEQSESSYKISEFWDLAEDVTSKHSDTTHTDYKPPGNLRANTAKKEEALFHDAITKHNLSNNALHDKSLISYRNAEFDTALPRKKVAQSLSSHLVANTDNVTYNSTLDDEDSIFIFSEEVEAKVRAVLGTITKTKKEKVGFSDHKNTIHHFDAGHSNDDLSASYYSQTDDDETYESDYSRDTFDTKATYSSVYTKSMQSEVEDAVKDLFFIGRSSHNAPGRRRKVKDRADVKEWKKSRRRAKAKAQKTSRPNEYEESERNHGSTKNDSNMINLQLDWVWGYVEDGINAVGEAFGLSDSPSIPSSLILETKEKSNPKSGDKSKNSPKDKIRHINVPNKYEKNSSRSPTSQEGQSDLTKWKERETARASINQRAKQKQILSVIGVKELAICAAQIYHQNQNLDYDGTEIDILTEIKLNTITISLPLGLLFEENNAGCWVTRVFRSGNAAKSAVNRIEIGDQLVSINGTSAFQMKIDETCAVINSSSNPKAIELVFIRYIGPLRVQLEQSVISEQYEIKDNPLVSPKASKPPPPPPRMAELLSTRLITEAEKDMPEEVAEAEDNEVPYIDVVIKEEELCKFNSTPATVDAEENSMIKMNEKDVEPNKLAGDVEDTHNGDAIHLSDDGVPETSPSKEQVQTRDVMEAKDDVKKKKKKKFLSRFMKKKL